MNKRPDITEVTKHNLREAFWTVFEKKQIEKISVSEITRLAGYNRGTFYLYYKDIYDILEQCENEILGQIYALLMRNLPDIKNHDFNNLIKNVLELVKPYSAHTMILLGSNGDPRFCARLKELLRPLFTMTFLGEDTVHTEYQKTLLEEFWLSGILGIILKWSDDPSMPIEDLIAFIVPAIYPK